MCVIVTALQEEANCLFFSGSTECQESVSTHAEETQSVTNTFP